MRTKQAQMDRVVLTEAQKKVLAWMDDQGVGVIYIQGGWRWPADIKSQPGLAETAIADLGL